MARSLRDELLKAGLVTDEQAARAERGSRQSSKPAANSARKSTRGLAAGESRNRPSRRGARHAANREPRESRQRPSAPASVESAVPDPEERVRQLNIEIRRILDAEAEKAEPEGDTPFHFARGDRLKRLYVSADQRRRLAAGELAIVGFRGRHHLVPRRAGERVAELRPEVYVFIETGETGEPGEAGTDAAVDVYEGYEVPDSLVW